MKSLDRRQHRLVSAMLACVLLAGCSGRAGEPSDQDRPPPVRRVATKGPVTLTVEIAPGTVDYTQQAVLIVELVADDAVTVELDDFGRVLASGEHRFELKAVLVSRVTAKPIGDGKLRWTDVYRLSFFLPGDYELPPATASFVSVHAASDAGSNPVDGSDETLPERQTVETEPLTIVARDTSSTTLSQDELQKITVLDPVDLPRPWTHWLWIVGGAGAVIALAIWMFMRRRRQRIEAAATPIPAHEWAWQQLSALIGDDLLPIGRVQEFYYRVSGIVRGYIERRFGVSAPEMTTEEFLEAAVADRRFGDEHTAGLRDFMTACDLVKYARHEPASGEADGALRAARDFIDRTRLHDVADDHTKDAAAAEERAA